MEDHTNTDEAYAHLDGMFFSGNLLDAKRHTLPTNESVGYMIIQEKATLAQLEQRLIDAKTEAGECLYYLAIVKQRARIAELYEMDEKTKVHLC